jgi:hypothetical protein
MANTTIKNLGISIAALLASYGISKIADKSTSFVDTRTAITSVVLQSAQELITAQLQKDAGITSVTADTTKTTIAQ